LMPPVERDCVEGLEVPYCNAYEDKFIQRISVLRMCNGTGRGFWRVCVPGLRGESGRAPGLAGTGHGPVVGG